MLKLWILLIARLGAVRRALVVGEAISRVMFNAALLFSMPLAVPFLAKDVVIVSEASFLCAGAMK